MNYYQMGLASGESTPTPARVSGKAIKVGEDPPKSQGMSELAKTGIAIGIVAVIAGWFFLRSKPPEQGPDTRDIEEEIRRRGLDPYKFGLGHYRRA